MAVEIMGCPGPEPEPHILTPGPTVPDQPPPGEISLPAPSNQMQREGGMAGSEMHWL